MSIQRKFNKDSTLPGNEIAAPPIAVAHEQTPGFSFFLALQIEIEGFLAGDRAAGSDFHHVLVGAAKTKSRQTTNFESFLRSHGCLPNFSRQRASLQSLQERLVGQTGLEGDRAGEGVAVWKSTDEGTTAGDRDDRGEEKGDRDRFAGRDARPSR